MVCLARNNSAPNLLPGDKHSETGRPAVLEAHLNSLDHWYDGVLLGNELAGPPSVYGQDQQNEYLKMAACDVSMAVTLN